MRRGADPTTPGAHRHYVNARQPRRHKEKRSFCTYACQISVATRTDRKYLKAGAHPLAGPLGREAWRMRKKVEPNVTDITRIARGRRYLPEAIGRRMFPIEWEIGAMSSTR